MISTVIEVLGRDESTLFGAFEDLPTVYILLWDSYVL